MEHSTLAKQEAKESAQLETGKDIDVKSIDREELNKPLYGNDGGQEASETAEASEFPERREWTEEEKREKQLESGWSDLIMDAIRSLEEYEIYKQADLQEVEIGGRPCLIRSDIDLSQEDAMGRTNKERMEMGLAPLTPEGKAIELHHIGQKADSPLAELTIEEHRGKGNDSILHDKTIESDIDRNQFNMEKADHWKNRAELLN